MEDLTIDSNPLRIIEDENDFDSSLNTHTTESQVCLKIIEEENSSQSDMNNDGDRDNNLHRLSLRIDDDDEGVEQDSIITNEAVNSTMMATASDDFKPLTPEMEHAGPIDDSVVHLLGQINDIVGQMLINL